MGSHHQSALCYKHFQLLHARTTQHSNMPFTASDICKILLAIILPPLGVFLERGCNADFLINILLTILGYIPGIIHALYIIFKFQRGRAKQTSRCRDNGLTIMSIHDTHLLSLFASASALPLLDSRNFLSRYMRCWVLSWHEMARVIRLFRSCDGGAGLASFTL